jgi:hypothetical protein
LRSRQEFECGAEKYRFLLTGFGGTFKVGGDVMRRNDLAAAGRVVFSVELELAIGRSTVARQQQMDHLTGKLLSLFEEHRLPATWAVADPAHSAATGGIAASRLAHEVAVLGEPSWLGPGAGRLRIERELSRRVGGAREMGISVSTLVLREVAAPLDLSLLLEQQISAVSYPAGRSAQASAIPAELRFGVWQAPAAWRLPLAPCWWQPLGWQVAGRLRQASRTEHLLHVAVDGDALVDQGDQGLAQIASVASYAVRCRTAGMLTIGTMAEFAAENLAQRFPQPAKSLLAPAA